MLQCDRAFIDQLYRPAQKKYLKMVFLPFKNTKNILNGQAENENKMFGVLPYLF